MRDVTRNSGGARGLGLVLLGACALWLVLQNTLLLAAVLWTDPHRVVTVAAALVKAGAAVAACFWTSPAGMLVAGSVVVAAIVAPALLARPPVGGEVRRG